MSAEVKQNVWAFFKEKGLSDEAVAGIMGNVALESNFDSTATNKSSGAFGLFQWLGSRYNELVEYATNRKTMVSDVDTQLNFAWEEMKTTHKSTLEAMESDKYTTPSEYAEVFEKKFEKSGGQGLEQRIQYAEEIYSEFKGTNYDYQKVTMLDVAAGDKNLGLKWWGDVVRVVLLIGLILTGVIFLYIAIMSLGNGGEDNGNKE